MQLKKISLYLFFVLLWAPVSLWANSSDRVEVQAVEGLVQYRLSQSSEWQTLEVGLLIPVNSLIISGRNASARLGSGDATIEIRPLSRIELSSLRLEQDRQETAITMSYGSLRTRVRRASGRGTDFSVRTPVSTASIRGTDFEYSGQELRVFSGDVAFANLTGQQHSVRAGQVSRTYRHQSIESVEATLLDQLRF